MNKRFRRTKEELALGLSPEEAMSRRNLPAIGMETPNLKVVLAKPSAKRGDIVLRPQKGVSSDYFDKVPSLPVEVILDGQWYGWFDTLVSGPYEGNAHKLLQHIMDLGIGEALTRFHFPADIKEYERPVNHHE